MKTKTVLELLIERYGLKFFKAKKIMLKMGLHETAVLADCDQKQKNLMKEEIHSLKLNLIDKKKDFYIKKMQDFQIYRGYRHYKGLPVNGQRTHTNGRTQKRLVLWKLSTIKTN